MIQEIIPSCDQSATEGKDKNKISAMFHTSEELGVRNIHNPTRLEAVEFNLKTVELESFHNKENLRSLGKIVKTLIDQNTLQQKLIDQNRVRIQQLEEAQK